LQTVTGAAGTVSMAWILARKPRSSQATSNGQIVHAESADKFGQLHKRGDYGRANASPI